MNLNDWFDKGISKEAYINDLDNHRENFHTVYENFHIPEADQLTLQKMSGIRAIVLAEVWCGHCMMDVPILLKMLETANIPVSFLPRDDNLELMDQYTTNGNRVIPIFIFIDDEGNQVGQWGPWAPEVKELTDKMKADLPSKEDPAYKEAFRSIAGNITELFTKDNTYWVPTYQSIMKALR